MGRAYRVCVDYDGATSSLGWVDSGYKVFVHGPHELKSRWLLRSTEEQRVYFTCHAASCSTNWRGYFATNGCYNQYADGPAQLNVDGHVIYTRPRDFVQSSGNLWYVSIRGTAVEDMRGDFGFHFA